MNKWILAFALLCTCCFYVACNGHPVKKKNVAITEVQPVIITVADTAIWRKIGMVPDFYYHDSLGHGHQVLIGKTENKLIIPSAVFLLQADWLQTPFYIFPGEHIVVSKDGPNNILLTVAGNQQRSNELLLTRDLVKATGALMPSFTALKKINTVAYAEELSRVEDDVKMKARNRLAFIDTFSRHHNISHAFKKMVENVVSNAAINDELLLLWKNKNIPNLSNVVKLEIDTCISRLDAQDTTLYNYMFYYALSNAVSISTTKYIGNEIFDSTDFAKKFAFIKSNFTTGAKSFLLGNILNQAINSSIPISKNAVKDFYADCTISTYKSLIAEKIMQQGEFNYPKGSSKLLLADGKTVKNIQDVFASHKGQLILIDFWASWCSPCRAELPCSHRLKQLYAGKNIAFVYIATDDEVHDWKNASKEEALDTNDNWLLLNSQTSSFIAQNNIQAIPRLCWLVKMVK